MHIRKNHPIPYSFVVDDICQLDTEKIKQNHPTVDIAMGCTSFVRGSFSQKGKRLSLDGPEKFSISLQFVWFVAAFKPKYFALENKILSLPLMAISKNRLFQEFGKVRYEACSGVLCAVDFEYRKIEGERCLLDN